MSTDENPVKEKTHLFYCPFHPDGPEIKLNPLEGWLDNQDVMRLLHISPRTLQTLRANGTLPYSCIGHKLYYKHQDIQRILQDNYAMYKLRNGNTE